MEDTIPLYPTGLTPAQQGPPIKELNTHPGVSSFATVTQWTPSDPHSREAIKNYDPHGTVDTSILKYPLPKCLWLPNTLKLGAK